MDWISWSRTWSTKSTTTTIRKPLRCSLMNSLWKRMYLLLQADQRLKQNHQDVLLLAHRQELDLSVKDFGLMLSQEFIRLSFTQCQTTEYSSSSWWSTSRRGWSDWILETKRWSSEDIWVLSKLVWWFMEEQDGRRRRQQEKISMLCWSVRTRNSLPLSLSRSFRTQSHWSFITGQCVFSGQFLRVHLSHWMYNQITFHHQCRIDTGRPTLEQTTDSILPLCGSYGQRTQGSWRDRLGSTASCTKHAQSMEETSKYGVLGRHQPCSEEKIEVLSNTVGRDHSSRNTPSLLYPESCCDGICRIIYEKVCLPPRPPPRISFKDNWMKELDSEVAGSSKDSQRIQPKSKTNYQERWEPWVSNHLVRSLRRSEKMSCLVAKAQTQERGDLWMDHHPARVVCQCLLNL